MVVIFWVVHCVSVDEGENVWEVFKVVGSVGFDRDVVLLGFVVDHVDVCFVKLV